MHVFIPQIRPINWLLLFVLFNLSYYLSLVKISHIGSVLIALKSKKKEGDNFRFYPKI